MSKATPPNRRQRVEQGIYKRLAANGREVYEIGYRDVQGTQRWRKVDGGIKAARAALARAHAARSRGERVTADPRLRFNDAADAWWEARVVKLRPATQSAYRAGLTYLRREFGRSRLADIAPRDVAAFIGRQQQAGLKGWTIKGHLTVLSGVFQYASRHLGFIGTSPVSLLDRVERPSSEDERPKRILDGAELRRLLDAIDEPYRIAALRSRLGLFGSCDR
jgi:integrase